MTFSNLYQRRTILTASVSLISCGGIPVNAEPVDEGKELLLSIKRVIDQDLIDKPERASQILDLAIDDNRGPNEDVQQPPVIGVNRPRKVFTEMRASVESSDQRQRHTFGQVWLYISGFDKRTGNPIRLTDADIIAVFGDKFILASTITMPQWRPNTDFSDWSGNYPNATFIYKLRKDRQTQMLVKFGFNTQLVGITLRVNKQGN